MAVEIDLAGRRVLVTGAGQGVGAGIAAWLAAAGAEVLVNDIDGSRAESAAADLAGRGGRAVAVPFDVTDHEAVLAALREVGPVDGLVNNAGNAGVADFDASVPFVDTSPADWERYLDVNLYGVMHCVHAVLPGMIERGAGRIVNVVSDAARVGAAHLAPYSAAKAGAAGFARSIAVEVARHGITVNNVSLGTMRTPLSEGLWGDPARAEQQQRLLSEYPIRRPGVPEDAAWMVGSLLAEEAGWITGQTVAVNGGYSFTL